MNRELKDIAAKFRGAGKGGEISLAQRHAAFLAENSSAGEASELRDVLKENKGSRSFSIEIRSFLKLVDGLSEGDHTPHATRIETNRSKKKKKKSTTKTED